MHQRCAFFDVGCGKTSLATYMAQIRKKIKFLAIFKIDSDQVHVLNCSKLIRDIK